MSYYFGRWQAFELTPIAERSYDTKRLLRRDIRLKWWRLRAANDALVREHVSMLLGNWKIRTRSFTDWNDASLYECLKTLSTVADLAQNYQPIVSTDETILSLRAVEVASTSVRRCWWTRKCRWDCSLQMFGDWNGSVLHVWWRRRYRRRRTVWNCSFWRLRELTILTPRLVQKMLTIRRHVLSD